MKKTILSMTLICTALIIGFACKKSTPSSNNSSTTTSPCGSGQNISGWVIYKTSNSCIPVDGLTPMGVSKTGKKYFRDSSTKKWYTFDNSTWKLLTQEPANGTFTFDKATSNIYGYSSKSGFSGNHTSNTFYIFNGTTWTTSTKPNTVGTDNAIYIGRDTLGFNYFGAIDTLTSNLTGTFMYVESCSCWTSLQTFTTNPFMVANYSSGGNVYFSEGNNVWATFGGTPFSLIYSVPNSSSFGCCISNIVVSANNTLWLQNNTGYILNTNTSQTYNVGVASGIGSNNLGRMTTDNFNNVWFCSLNSGMVKFDGTNYTMYNTSNSPLVNGYTGVPQIDKDNAKWIIYQDANGANAWDAKFY
jgi:hypothetical protein